MHFTFALTARYPTEKAYGVTTTGSVRALRELGHSVEVVSAYNVSRQKKFVEADKKYSRQTTILSNIAKWTFRLNQIRFGVELALRNKNSNARYKLALWVYTDNTNLIQLSTEEQDSVSLP